MYIGGKWVKGNGKVYVDAETPIDVNVGTISKGNKKDTLVVLKSS